MSRSKILVVEDENIVAKEIQKSLIDLGYRISGLVSSGDEAIRSAEKMRPDVVLMDIKLKGEQDGIETAEEIKNRFDIPVIYLTAYADEDTLHRAKITEPHGYILKPFKSRELNAIIEMTLYKHQAEKLLLEREERFRRLFEQSNDAIFIHNLDGSIIDVNTRACEMLGHGRKELLLITMGMLHPDTEDEVTKRAYQTIRDTGSICYESQFKKSDGTLIEVDISAGIIDEEKGIIQAIARDITERRRTERMLKENEKLIAQGRMATRIAHEINNPLGGIKNSFLLIKSGVPEDHPYYEYVDIIEREIDRISRIIDQMLNLYRPGKKPITEFSVDEVIRDVMAMLESKCRSNQVSITTEVSKSPLVVNMSRDHLIQVLFNIIQNGIDASPPGGVVKIGVSEHGDMLTISVSDEGDGIPEDLRSQVYEPFFTTKKDSRKKGLGLGLSVCKSILDTMDGSIRFESEIGKGTVFHISLPFT